MVGDEGQAARSLGTALSVANSITELSGRELQILNAPYATLRAAKTAALRSAAVRHRLSMA